ncbi:MAG: hypothetical protein OXF08_06940 [Bacteroidetes bacterium]|nr:hypothetical protein [Bacteroidota bacterium]
MPSPIRRTVESYLRLIRFRVSSWLVRRAIVTTGGTVRSLTAMVKKINQSPALDLHILKNLQMTVENLPRFKLFGNFQSERYHRSGMVFSLLRPLIMRGQIYIRLVISKPIQGALQLVTQALRRLYRLDKKIHNRNPRILNVLTDLLHSAEHIETIVHSFKPVNESVSPRFRIP